MIALYRLDRAELKRLSSELRALLVADDRAAMAQLLDLPPQLFGRERLIDSFLLPEKGELAEPFIALRSLAKERALRQAFLSDSPALEGRLRAFEPLRADPRAAAAVDKLLSPARLPWYLRAPGAACGWLDGAEREQLCAILSRLRAALTPELCSFADGLGRIDGDAVAHEAL